jgi:hypothetical protein
MTCEISGLLIDFFAANKAENSTYSISCCCGKYGQQKINVKLKGIPFFLEGCNASSRAVPGKLNYQPILL